MVTGFRESLGSFRLLAAFALAALTLAAGAAEPAPGFSIEVTRGGETFIVNALLFAPVSRREAWAVLTNFDHMTGFVPNLTESRVVERAGNRLTVARNGVARFDAIEFPFESLRRC